MSTTRRLRLQRAGIIVPLAIGSFFLTANLAGAGSDTTLSAAEESAAAAGPSTLPDGSSLPTSAIKAPASLSAPSTVRSSLGGSRGDVVGAASTNAIPAAALAAYQRAETVINAADESCRIPWQLVAAIGRVESDHGRANGNVLSEDGVSRPGIFGIPLNGKNSTTKITDTDAGQLDHDKTYDRAVGAMQFIPSTWSVVGVDADGDGQRNPQDIDDSALATAVYLCSGSENLSELPGARSAVFRYNHSKSYVDLVISIMNAYLQGDFTSVPTGTLAAPTPIQPAPGAPKPPAGAGGSGGAGTAPVTPPAPAPAGGGGGGGSAPGPSSAPPAPTPSNPAPSAPAPTKPPSNPLPPAPTPLPPSGSGPVDNGLTKAEATAKCIAQGVVDVPTTPNNELDDCVAKLQG